MVINLKKIPQNFFYIANAYTISPVGIPFRLFLLLLFISGFILHEKHGQKIINFIFHN